MINSNLDSKKKMIFILVICTIIWLIIITRLVFIQLVEGEKWTTKANNQLYISRIVTAGRGTIYDSIGKIILAQSSSVETVSVNPLNIEKENKEKVAKAFSEIFELDYEKVLKK